MMIRSVGAVALFLILAPGAGRAQESEGFTWENATEVSYVSTGGNASTTTFGLKGTLEGESGPNQLKLEVGGVRASSDVTTRRAVGSVGDFDVDKSVRSETTAESYFARGRYDRSLAVGFGFAGAGWERNTFSGIQNRYQVMGGFGRTFVDGDSGRFKADVGLTYTYQKDVAPTPGADDRFAGYRFSAEAVRALSETSRFQTELVLNNSISSSDDVRVDWLNSLSVAVNSTLALKTSLQLLWDNTPALISVPLETTGGTPTGTDVLTPSDGLDTVLTLTLVITI
jgi:putative salt-induced outer membrane protein YdiY